MEKQIKSIEDQGKKEDKALKALKPTEQKWAIKDVVPADQLNE